MPPPQNPVAPKVPVATPPTVPITPQAPAAPAQKLTPQLNSAQLMQNIDALKKAGQQTQQIQEYVNNYTKAADGSYVLKGSTPAAPAPSTPIISNPMTDINKAGSDVYDAITGSGERAGQGSIQRGVGAASSAAMAIPNAVADVIPGGKSALNVVGKLFENTINAAGTITGDIGNLIGSSPALQKLVNEHPDLVDSVLKHSTNTAETLNSLGNVANTILMAEGGAKTIKETAELPGKVRTINTLSRVAKSSPEATAQAATAKTAKAAQTEAAGAKIIEDAVRNNAKKYAVPSRVLHEAETEHGTDPVGVISSYGKKAMPIIENGKIDPTEAIAFLKNQIHDLGAIKSDAVFLNTSKITPAEFFQHTRDMIQAQRGKGWSEARIADTLANFDKMAKRLNSAYHNKPLDLNEIDKIKTEQTGLSKSYNNSSAKPFELDTHGIVGKSAREIVEKFTEDAPTKELNKLMQSHYDAIDLLESLRAKAPHGGRLTKMSGRLTGEIFGAAAGSTVGHPFVGAVAGRIGADMIDATLNSHLISNPLKRMIIEQMQGVPSEVKQRMLQYIEQNSPSIEELGDRSPNQNPESGAQRPPQTGQKAPSQKESTSPKSTAPKESVKSSGKVPKAEGGAPDNAGNKALEAGLSINTRQTVKGNPDSVVHDIYLRGYLEQDTEAATRVFNNFADAYNKNISTKSSKYSVPSKRISNLFLESGGQKSLGTIHGEKIEIGDWAAKHVAQKTAEGKADRFPQSEVKSALTKTERVVPASDNPKSYRYDNKAWISRRGDNYRVVYTRTNAKGAQEVIAWHELPAAKLPKFLSDIGIPGQTRTGIASLEGKQTNPLSYGDVKSLPQQLESIKQTRGEPITSAFRSPTVGGRIKDALKEYFENMQPGLTAKDVTEGGQKFDINLGVEGEDGGQMATSMDETVHEGDQLYQEGKYEEAQKKYNEALSTGVKTLQDAFENTGIKIKPRGVAVEFKKGDMSPVYDATAIVPKGKEDFFHYVLADIADKQFHQYSMFTHRPVDIDTPLGIKDAARGISHEPQMRLTVPEALTGDQIKIIGEMAKKSGISALSVREGGRTIDIINLTHYNNDYGQFSKQAADFKTALDKQGIIGVAELGTAETRFLGSNPDEGHGAASYAAVRNKFRQENSGYFNTDEDFTSKVIEKIKNKEKVSKQELEQITKSQDVTPLERSVVLDAMSDMKDTPDRVGVSDLAVKIKGKSLPIKVTETEAYANYGLDNVGLDGGNMVGRDGEKIRDEGALTLVFETPVAHGEGGHFDNPSHIGHVRVFIDNERDWNKPEFKAPDVYEVRKVGEGKDARWGIFNKKESTDKGAVDTTSYATKKAASDYLNNHMPDVNDVNRIGYITELQSDVFQKNSPAELAYKTLPVEVRDALTIKENKIRGDYHIETERLYGQKQAENKAIEEKYGETTGVTIKKQEAVQQQYRDAVDKEVVKRQWALDQLKKEATQNLTTEQQQFLHMAKNDRYKDILLRGALQHLEKLGATKVRIATPYSAAKIEGFMGNQNGVAPYYATFNGTPFDHDTTLNMGDTLFYLDEEHTVLSSDSYGIEVAPSDKVRSFDWDTYVEDEMSNAWENALYELKSFDEDYGVDWTTPEGAQTILDKKEKFIDYHAKMAMKAVIEGKDPEEVVTSAAAEHANKDNLEDIYGRDKVFVDQDGRGGGTVYILDEKQDTERLEQPDQYDEFDENNSSVLDSSPEEIRNNFEGAQRSVLMGYYDLHKDQLTRLAKELNVPIDYIDLDGNGTWYEMPLPKVKQKLF